MPGVTQCESQTVLAKSSPTKKSRLSLRFFQKKETKRALDFEAQTSEPQNAEEKETEIADQVVPAAQESPSLCCAKKESLLPFVGFNNLGNTCYLNSILQVLCYCPGFKTGVKHMCDIISKKKEAPKEDKEQTEDKGGTKDDPPASYDVICSLSSLIHSVEHLQLNFLSNPDGYDSELATQPRRLLNTLRELNPMYEGYLQHDAQEVLQCILGNIQDACQALKKEQPKNLQVPDVKQAQDLKDHKHDGGETDPAAQNTVSDGTKSAAEIEPNENGKRKSDNEVGNAKKKTKLTKELPAEDQRLTRSKRKSQEKTDQPANAAQKPRSESIPTNTSQKKSKLGLNWLRSSKQPSILSKFCSLSKHGSTTAKPETESGSKSQRHDQSSESGQKNAEQADHAEVATGTTSQNESTEYELVEKLFQGQLVLRTRCLECESYTERREDFQDISVPVQENEPPAEQDCTKISPEPRLETKSLKWAISQFASVERIVGEDKYFCENCHHYTEAERSLLFDKIPEIVTIHLKCFAANSSEFDCYGGLSKVTTPLLTPLHLSLEEWSTKPTKDRYGLFAVVMHSGVTISSGHYTAYVKITDLQELYLDQVKALSDHQEVVKAEPLTEEEARVTESYDDGEVVFRAGGPLAASKVNKKNSDTVGLLGGQKSKSDFEPISNKIVKSEKIPTMFPNDESNPDGEGFNGELQAESGSCGNMKLSTAFNIEKAARFLLQSLTEYEGKWLLFDDSEVKVTEEKDFLSTISPSTPSTSTPYLLFYKKISEQ
uniref:Ubiquitin carboxyl-terminal hydrolase n=1 Tax=Leptobrachium leishanense TaxID=445787 RepID=A0A8C5PII7_9ANUR